MMVLGNHIIPLYDTDKVRQIFHDLDFKDRTLLKIITDNSFQPLFLNDKINILLEEIWEGKNTYECDG